MAISHDSRFAYLTLQENNGIVRLDIQSRLMTFFGAGQTTHEADLTDGPYMPTESLTAFREPDGIVLDKTSQIFLTADEGDTNNAAGAAACGEGEQLVCSTRITARCWGYRLAIGRCRGRGGSLSGRVGVTAAALNPRAWTSRIFVA